VERPIGTKVFRRRQFLNLAAGAVMAPALPRLAMAQTYPTRPITMIVPYGAGTSTDIVGRLLAERMGKSLGQPIIIENVGGADGSIGTGRTSHARPDGYTIELGTNGTHALNAAFYSLPYDVLNDFLAISPVVTGSILLYGRKALPANDLNGLVSWLKANPQGTSMGVVSAGYRHSCRKKRGPNLPLSPIVAKPLKCRIWLPDRSTSALTRRFHCGWCERGA
jgi:tripartite-type tricarboxylate transporter receptor subunit TctC